MTRTAHRIAALLGALCVAVLAGGCVSTDAPPGVGAGIAFQVTPIHPNSYDVVAGGSLRQSSDVLRDAWRKKADQVAAGRKFRATRLIERVSETIGPGYPIGLPVRGRSVSGTITLID